MSVWRGAPHPLGATPDAGGTNFALFSEHATGVDLSLFDADGTERRVNLRERTDSVWHGYLPDMGPGQRYGFRVDGPFEPQAGHRFNPNKLLLDPYARRIDGPIPSDDRLLGYRPADPAADLSFDPRDSAPVMPRCMVVDPGAFDWAGDAPPATPLDRTVVYELHVKGFTRQHPEVDPAVRGTYAGLAAEAPLRHLRELGVTAVELLPVQHHLTERFLAERGLTNAWGYNTIGFFAPDVRYASGPDPVGEFKRMVAALHRSGIEVILDVVYNHTGEGDELGPTVAFRGIDNAAYYRLDRDDPRRHVDYTGTGNTLDTSQPRVRQLIMDSLRYWVTEMHVDGFRFDLAVTLGRGTDDFEAGAPLFELITQDPVLERVKLIAEPWDVGPGGYQVGGFPPRWSEWNGRYRDTVRRFWRGLDGQAAELASRVAGSSDLYAGAGRAPQASVNFVTSHDGFTLSDLVSYERRHNEANLQDNSDGPSDEQSMNFGVEGPTSDAAILEARDRQRRNLLATLLLSQGVPMLLAGDEMGRTQSGNSNAYAQDNPMAWLSWDLAPRDRQLRDFVAGLLRLRAAHPVLRRRCFFQGRPIRGSSLADLTWYDAHGTPLTDAGAWAPDLHALGLRLAGDAIEETDEHGAPIVDETLLIILNAGDEAAGFRLPDDHGGTWELSLDTSSPTLSPVAGLASAGEVWPVAPRSVVLLRLRPGSR